MGVTTMTSLRGPALEYYNSLPAETRGQLATLCTLFEGCFGRQELPETRSNLKTIIQRVDEPLPEFAERTLRMAADGYSGIGENGSKCWRWMLSWWDVPIRDQHGRLRTVFRKQWMRQYHS